MYTYDVYVLCYGVWHWQYNSELLARALDAQQWYEYTRGIPCKVVISQINKDR